MKKKIKKAAALIAALLTALTLFGCSDTQASDSSDSSVDSDNENVIGSSTEIPDSSDSGESNSKDNSSTETNSVDSDESVESSDSSDNKIVNDTRIAIVETAQALIGIDFVSGMATPEDGFDNSGLIYYVLRENGFINCPRGTSSQMKMGTCVELSDILPGDILYFSDTDEQSDKTIYFGGIYIGENTMIYSPYPGEKVKTADISSGYWSKRFYCAISVG